MNITTKTAMFAAALTLAPLAASAEDLLPGTVTGNVALTNDYIFRGISQTSNNAAIQGGLDWDSGAGFHLGTWGSSVNFHDGNSATTELDLYGGYAGKIDNFSYDVGGTFYWYPGAVNALHYNYLEAYGKVGYDFGLAALTTGVAYTPENFGKTGDATYFNAVVSVPVMDMLSVSGGAGYNLLSQGRKDQTDWNIGATLKVANWFDIDARYYDSDIHWAGNLADDRFVVKISRSF